jgi:hypothetical protein
MLPSAETGSPSRNQGVKRPKVNPTVTASRVVPTREHRSGLSNRSSGLLASQKPSMTTLEKPRAPTSVVTLRSGSP